MKAQARNGAPFEIRTERQGSGLFIALFGELDLTTRQLFDPVLTELKEPVKEAVIDLSGLTYMDSTGLFLVIELWQRCSNADIAIAFEGGSGQIHKLLGLTGLDRVLS